MLKISFTIAENQVAQSGTKVLCSNDDSKNNVLGRSLKILRYSLTYSL
jgi:hypothetical protein